MSRYVDLVHHPSHRLSWDTPLDRRASRLSVYPNENSILLFYWQQVADVVRLIQCTNNEVLYI
jgi:hypothetical protein